MTTPTGCPCGDVLCMGCRSPNLTTNTPTLASTDWRIGKRKDGYAYLSTRGHAQFARFVAELDDGTPQAYAEIAVERVNGWNELVRERDTLKADWLAVQAERDALRSALQKLTDEVGMNYLDLTEGEKLADSYDRARALLGGAK